jgi:hypothetical protein
MSKIGKICCKCIHPCGGYCIVHNAVSTTLTITGNHPATLVFPITYDVLNDQATYGENNCQISGTASVEASASTGELHTECRQVRGSYFDGMDVEVEKCCDPNWVSVFDGSVEAMLKSSSRAVAVHKYLNSEVSVRAGEKTIDGEEVCGVWVRVCLRYARYYYNEGYSCSAVRVSGTVRTPTTQFSNCCDESDEYVSVDYENTANDPNATATACDPEAAFDAGGFISVPPCPEDDDPFADMEPSVLAQYTYGITREKFIPLSKSVGCGNDAGPYQVTLSPSDEVSSFTCGTTPDDVYWEWDDCSYEDDDPRLPTPSLQASLCGEFSFTPVRWGLFFAACDGPAATQPDRDIVCPQPGNTGLGCIGIGSTDHVCSLRDAMDSGIYRTTIANRSRGATVDTDIVDGEIMFGHSLDTWVLTIEQLGGC